MTLQATNSNLLGICTEPVLVRLQIILALCGQNTLNSEVIFRRRVLIIIIMYSLIQAAGPIEQRIEHKHTQTHRKSTQQTHIRE